MTTRKAIHLHMPPQKQCRDIRIVSPVDATRVTSMEVNLGGSILTPDSSGTINNWTVSLLGRRGGSLAGSWIAFRMKTEDRKAYPDKKLYCIVLS